MVEKVFKFSFCEILTGGGGGVSLGKTGDATTKGASTGSDSSLKSSGKQVRTSWFHLVPGAHVLAKARPSKSQCKYLLGNKCS